ncbi:WecB/TagA/CpsF family glycosyltransferase [Glaciimonas sp. Gout2]|uniref:WecB/TagA/CpsF family glycosyltransferase n=1 Tax=unclassified Glaciimonas TaxID=2644401 RepID=UPI002AB489A8|nr:MULTISPECIES: WecB/TagA/CpsF family glycosyltransferase [unclassified Glaciimonas]MDY7547139.1 WecB/TagA/CpsF family glycosyltransferase [Glaciimonas sp. CA11.2]MEB0011018.1 WecB/TagA/CpsF family glycosyltransferase [Glaciimonas sp. Cout2]MEB0084580.1 WecB/TagA/CpsF family glycosyltransferase [Glaciimonas sp. Gout2]
MSLEKMNPIAGYPVRKTTSRVLAGALRRTLRRNKKTTLFFANTNFIVQCRYLLDRMRSDSVLIVNDGVGMDIAAFLFSSQKFDENLNGTDFIPYFFSESAQSMRVFMLGSKPETLTKAAHHLRDVLGQTVVGACDGYGGFKENSGSLIEAINFTEAEVLLVALGNPIQEEWILANRDMLNANLVIGVGALFDFWSGDKQRAPLFVQRTRLEWLYRLCLEPRRLLFRYTVDILRFLLLCRKHRWDI